MIVRDIMTTRLVTVAPDDTLAHAANVLRQYQFHHLPVVRTMNINEPQQPEHTPRKTLLLLEGLLTSQDIDMAVALAQQNASTDGQQRPWQERTVAEVMHRALIRVTPATGVAAASQLLVERGLDYLPVVEYGHISQESKTVLVGLLTRSDLLVALSRALGAFEPGMQLEIPLPVGDMTPLAETLRIASELHIRIRSIMAAPLADGVPHVATVRLGTINPTPLLMRLQAQGIHYSFGSPLVGDDTFAEGSKYA